MAEAVDEDGEVVAKVHFEIVVNPDYGEVYEPIWTMDEGNIRVVRTSPIPGTCGFSKLLEACRFALADLQARPFVGEDAEVLQVLEAAIKAAEEEVPQ